MTGDCLDVLNVGTGVEVEVILKEWKEHYRPYCATDCWVSMDDRGYTYVIPNPHKLNTASQYVWRPAMSGEKPRLDVAPITGFTCVRCNSYNEYASSNQQDGTYVCFECR